MNQEHPAIIEADRKPWTDPVLETLTVDLDAIANTSNGGVDSKQTFHLS